MIRYNKSVENNDNKTGISARHLRFEKTGGKGNNMGVKGILFDLDDTMLDPAAAGLHRKKRSAENVQPAELLLRLKRMGVAVGVMTSENDAVTLRGLSALGAAQYTDCILTSDLPLLPPPAADYLDAFCRNCGLRREEVWVVGRAGKDMRLAADTGAVGIRLGTENGSVPGQRLAAEDFGDLLRMVSAEQWKQNPRVLRREHKIRLYNPLRYLCPQGQQS